MANLILVRHGISDWNKRGLWTGLTDIGLAPEGVEEGVRAGATLRNFPIDIVIVTPLKRTLQTFEAIQTVLERKKLTVLTAPALNERDYGIYTGKNKWEIEKEIGVERFQAIRRGWDEPVPGGETLKDVAARVVPYYESTILPMLKEGKQILIVGHGNAFRALIKHLENLSDEEVERVEVGTGEIYVYEISPEGVVLGKEVLARNERAGKI
jgi:2,3-bisphosphoglycerate-dependent phosphoglycerate mutase